MVFTKSGGAPVTTAQAEALLDALNYHNTAGTQTGGDRTFTVKATASSGTSPKATFTISGDGDGIPEAEE
ncbi:hypothetical protein JZU54_02465, partial [bacterium]|nr:hypothetical protein [bacterium]